MIASVITFLGNTALFIPAIIILFAKFAPQSILPYAEYFPDTVIFNIAFYVAIACAILAPLSIIRVIENDNNEEKIGIFRFIKYGFLAIAAGAFGLYLGYAGTIKAGYIFGNITNTEEETNTDLRRLHVTDKQTNTSIQTCPTELITANKGDRPFYESFFYPSTLCVTNELFNSVTSGETIVLQGKIVSDIGFFIDSVWTETDLKELTETAKNIQE